MARRRTSRTRTPYTGEPAPTKPPRRIPIKGRIPRQLPTPDTRPPPVPTVPTQVTPLAELERRRAAIRAKAPSAQETGPSRLELGAPLTAGATMNRFNYFPQYDPTQGYTPQRPGGGLGPIVSQMLGGAVPAGERMIPLATEAGDVTMNILRTYGRNAAIDTEIGRSLLPGSIRNTVAQLLPWYAWGYESYQEMLKAMDYTEIPGTGAWVKNDEFEAETAGGGGYSGGGGGGGGGVTYGTIGGSSARQPNLPLIMWRI